MPINPIPPPTKTEKVQRVVARSQSRSESYLYRHAPVIAGFLAGLILGGFFRVL